MPYQNIQLETLERMAIMTINRPDKRNALNQKTRDEILQCLDDLQSTEIRVVIVTGAGDKAFIAGADIAEFEGRTALTQRDVMKRRRIFDAVEEFPKPVIAMINGFCLGGGLEFAMACDIRIAADSAKLGQPEINLGIIPGYAGSQRLSRLVGKGVALDLLLTGRQIKADEALAIGLVNRVVPAAELMTAAKAVANELASKAPIAMRYIIEAVNRGLEIPFESAQIHEATLFGLVASTADMREGTRAFLEKRKAQFKGE